MSQGVQGCPGPGMAERMLPEAFAMQLSRDAMIPSISEVL